MIRVRCTAEAADIAHQPKERLEGARNEKPFEHSYCRLCSGERICQQEVEHDANDDHPSAVVAEGFGSIVRQLVSVKHEKSDTQRKKRQYPVKRTLEVQQLFVFTMKDSTDDVDERKAVYDKLGNINLPDVNPVYQIVDRSISVPPVGKNAQRCHNHQQTQFRLLHYDAKERQPQNR